MSITLPDIPPYLTAPKLAAKAGQYFQQGLDIEIGWLARSYHIAKVGIIAETGLTYPQLYANDNTNNHFDIRADNKISAYSFLEIDRAYTRNEEEGEITYYFSAVFWGNLALIDDTKDYDFTSQLVKDAVDALEKLGAENLEIDERPESVFNKYTGITQELKQFLMRKYTGFKISFSYTETYTDNCEDDPISVCDLFIDRYNNLSSSDQECISNQIGGGGSSGGTINVYLDGELEETIESEDLNAEIVNIEWT